MITETQIREIANRTNNAIKSNTVPDERRLMIENAIRAALMEDRQPAPEPNAGCL